MATGKITKRAVDGMEAGERDAFLWDSDLRGFGLKLTPKGARTYLYQYRMGGREAATKRFTIGKHGSPWTPSTAREEAERLAVLVARGLDPVAADRERRRQAVDLRFDAYVKLFVEKAFQHAAASSKGTAERALRLHAVPTLGATALPAIRRADVAAMLDRLDPQQTALRANVYAATRRLFRWAVNRGDLERSPLEGMEGPPPAASRDRVLDDRELALAWDAADTLGYPFGPMLRLLIATGQRREEVAGLDWAELDRSTAMWTLPGARAKNDAAHLVPLNGLAVELLDELAEAIRPLEKGKRRSWPVSGLIFSTTGTTRVSGFARAKRRLDAAIVSVEQRLANAEDRTPSPVPAWRVHDLRRTVATGLQRLGIRLEVTEAVLNHLSGSRSGIVGVYQRHDWREEKRTALDAWGRHVAALEAAAATENVISIGSKRKGAR